MSARSGTFDAMRSGAYSPEQIQRAFLAALSSTESPGYNVLYGGGTFDDYSRHPNVAVPIKSGPNRGKTSSAAGKYQFLGSTWEDVAKRHNLPDFSPASQDLGAWHYAGEVYNQATGGDLMEALASGDPGRINAAAKILSNAWTSLPGGIEQAGGYGKQTFYDVFSRARGGTGAPPMSLSGIGSPTTAGAGGAGLAPSQPSGGQTSPLSLPAAKKQPWWKSLGKGLAEAGPMIGAGKSDIPQLAPPPAAAVVPVSPVPGINPAQAQAQRDQLAAALARLNSGRLF